MQPAIDISYEDKLNYLQKLKSISKDFVFLPLKKSSGKSAVKGKFGFLGFKYSTLDDIRRISELYDSGMLAPLFESETVHYAAFICGKHTNLSVIDLDKKELLKEMEEFIGAPASEFCRFIVETEKGFHLFYKYSDKLDKSEVGVRDKIDIRSGEVSLSFGVAFNPGYKEHTPIDQAELIEIPEKVLEYIFKDSRNERQKSSPLNDNCIFDEARVEVMHVDTNSYETNYDIIKSAIDRKHSCGVENVAIALTEFEEAEIIKRFFKNDKNFYKKRCEIGNRHFITIRICTIFAKDVTLDWGFIDTYCKEFLSDLVMNEPKDFEADFADSRRRYMPQVYAYAEGWLEKREKIQSLKTEAPTVSSNEAAQLFIESSPLVSKMYEVGKLFCQTGTNRFILLDLRAKENSVRYLHYTRAEMNLLLRQNYGEYGFAATKDSTKSVPMVTFVVDDMFKTPGFIFSETGDLGFNVCCGAENYPSDWLNKYHNKEVEPLTFEDVDEDTRHLFTNCFESIEDANYYYRSLAYHMSHPDEPNQHMICLFSETESTGKSTVCSVLGHVLYGKYAFDIDSGAHKSNFNAHFKEKFWVSFDDTSDIGDNLANEVKNFIGNKYITITEKNKDSAQYKNTAFYTWTSNDPGAFKLPPGNKNRRFVILNGGSKPFEPERFNNDTYTAIQERIPILFQVMRTLEMRDPNFSPNDMYKPENVERFARENPSDPYKALASSIKKYANDQSEENLELLEDYASDRIFTQPEEFVSYIVEIFSRGDFFIATPRLAEVIRKGKPRRAFRRACVSLGFDARTMYSASLGKNANGYLVKEFKRKDVKEINVSRRRML